MTNGEKHSRGGQHSRNGELFRLSDQERHWLEEHFDRQIERMLDHHWSHRFVRGAKA